MSEKKGQRIKITTDCVCDLPKELLDKSNVSQIPFYIITEEGRFCDMTEITSDNILEYIGSGHQAHSIASSPEEYRTFFMQQLETYDSVLHITITSGTSLAYRYASEAAEGCDGRVIVFDSLHLSTGLGLMVLKAAQLLDEGKTTEEIVSYLTDMRSRVSTSFMAYSADYLYRSGKVRKSVADLCRMFGVHPILVIGKNGRVKPGGIMLGKYEKVARRYIRKKLGKRNDIDNRYIFVTYAGCNTKMVSMLKTEVEKYNIAERVIVTKASATVSSNCGPNAFGVLFTTKNQ